MKLATREATKATRASEQAAYAACIGTQVSRSALLEAVQADLDAHHSAIASTYQTIVATKAESAEVVPQVDSFVLNSGKPIGLNLHIKNDGNSSAKEVHSRIRILLVERGANPEAVYPKGSPDILTPSLQEGEEILALKGRTATAKNLDGTERIATDRDIDDFYSGRKDLLAFIRVTYRDSLGVPHWINFCRTAPQVDSRSIKTPIHEHCIRYNKTDENAILKQAVRSEPVSARIPEIACPTPPQP